MQTFPPALRVVQSVAALQGADDALAAINTTLLSDGAIVLVRAVNSFYVLRKTATGAASSPEIIAPAQGGPGRWYKYGMGANYYQSVTLAVPEIPPQSKVSATIPVTGALTNSTQLLVYNILDSSIESLVVNPRISGLGSGRWEFANISSATVAAASVSLEVAILG